MTRGWDVAIVGAGPAGSAVSAGLSRAGARVALVERAVFPRDKLCGGFVSPEALTILPRLGIRSTPPADRFSWIRRFLLSEPRGRSAAGPLPERLGWGIPRRDLDAWLAAEAVASGVDFFDGVEIENIFRTDAGWRLDARGRTLPLALDATFLVLCEGRGGRLARRLRASGGLFHRSHTTRPHLPWVRPSSGSPARSSNRSPGQSGSSSTRQPAVRTGRLAFQGLLEAPAAIDDAVELHFFPGGYLGLQPCGVGLVNACGIAGAPANRSEAGLDHMLDLARAGNPICAERLAGARRVSAWRAAGGLHFGAVAPVAGEAFLAGDAAGSIEPFTGEGITMALAAGAALAGCLRPALSGDPAAVLAARRQWKRTWQRAFLPRLWFCRALGRAMQSPLLLECASQVFSRRQDLARRLVALTRTAPDSLPRVR